MSEENHLKDGGARVKFNCFWKGSISEKLSSNDFKIYESNASQLAESLLLQEKYGLSPVAPDGKVGGNGAIKVNLSFGACLIVSMSGKLPGSIDILKHICLVLNFNEDLWQCEYFAEQESVKPTSDTPMHYAALNLDGKIHMKAYPKAALHGHGLATSEVAEKLNIPCSPEDTLFSTREDMEALVKLIRQYPYPLNKVFIRKNHGYYLLGEDMSDCVENSLNKIILPYI